MAEELPSGNEGNCVEAGTTPGLVAVRDTKDQGHRPVIRVGPENWRRFTREITGA